MPVLRRRTILPPRLLRQTLFTAGLTWVCLRAALLLLPWRIQVPDWRAALVIALIPAVVVVLDLRLLRERTLLGNLGYGVLQPFGIALLTTGLLECLAQAGCRLAGLSP